MCPDYQRKCSADNLLQIRSGGPYDERNQYPASASGYVDTRQSAPALPDPNTFGVYDPRQTLSHVFSLQILCILEVLFCGIPHFLQAADVFVFVGKC